MKVIRYVQSKVIISIIGAPWGLGDLGRMAFLGSWGALVIILGEIGSKLLILGI